VFHISTCGTWSFVWGGQAHQSPPVATGLVESPDSSGTLKDWISGFVFSITARI